MDTSPTVSEGPAPAGRAGDSMLIEVQQAVFGYGSRAVVQVQRLRLDRGRCFGMFGPNGSGKTTLVRGLTGLLRPLSGAVTHMPGLRFGYLPQHRGLELQWPMTGLDAAGMAMSAERRWGWLGSAQGQVKDSMRALGALDLADRPFARLSGGQQQRILLAGAMALDPQVLVLDEPTGGLDLRSRDTLLGLLRQLGRSGLAIAIISHEIEDMQSLADEVAWLHPAEDPEHPSEVEVVAPGQMAQRLATSMRAVS